MNEQIIAFAALCQAASAVQNLARNGSIESDELSLLLRSIVNTNPANTLDVYGDDLKNLHKGFGLICQQLGDTHKTKDPELTRYIVSVIALSTKLYKNGNLMQKLGERIAAVDRQLQHYDIDNEVVIASLASIYSDLISPISNKIQIAGDVAVLKQTNNQHKIRALLLAAVRAAVLWRQLGGKRRNILFKRRQILTIAQQLQNQI
jgi:high frequency lysogenization protein